MASSEIVLGIDIGTGGVRATAVDVESGIVRAQATAPLLTTRSAGGARTQSVDTWIEAVSATTRQILGALDVPARVACVALTSAAHNAVVTMRGGLPTPPIVLWSDGRPERTLESLQPGVRASVRQRTRVELDSTWTFVQMKWLSEELGEYWDPIDLHLGHGAVVNWMTGEHVTDPSTAAGTGFFDPIAMQWCEELACDAGIPFSALPQVVPSRTVAGLVTAVASDRTGLDRGTLVVAGGTDTACELLAAGIVTPGPVLLKAASSGTAVTVVSEAVDNQRTIIYPHVVGDNWYLVSPTSSAWSSVAWATSILGGDIVELAGDSSAGAGGLSFLPHLDGERVPLWSRRAVGGFVGLQTVHQREDLARAVLEGVSFSLADALDYLEDVLGRKLGDVRLSGGGLQRKEAASILSSAIGRPARIAHTAEPSRGAAMLGQLAMGCDVGSDLASSSETLYPRDDLQAARAAYQHRQRSLNESYAHPGSR